MIGYLTPNKLYVPCLLFCMKFVLNFLVILGSSCCFMFFQPTSPSPKELSSSGVTASLLMPHLQNLFQQTSFQQVKHYPGFVCYKTLDFGNIFSDWKFSFLARILS